MYFDHLRPSIELCLYDTFQILVNNSIDSAAKATDCELDYGPVHKPPVLVSLVISHNVSHKGSITNKVLGIE